MNAEASQRKEEIVALYKSLSGPAQVVVMAQMTEMLRKLEAHKDTLVPSAKRQRR